MIYEQLEKDPVFLKYAKELKNVVEEYQLSITKFSEVNGFGKYEAKEAILELSRAKLLTRVGSHWRIRQDVKHHIRVMKDRERRLSSNDNDKNKS